MPVDVIKKLGVSNSPVTMDYSTLQSWVSAIPSDLTTTRTSTTTGGSTTSDINLDVSASSTDNFYTGHTLTISGNTRLITNYVGATKTATVGSWNGSSGTYPSAPSSGTTYVVDDVRWIGECYDQGTFTVSTGFLIAISGSITTDSTRNIIVRCAAGASFNAKSGVRTTALNYNASNGVAWTDTGNSSGVAVSAQYTVIDGIQYQHAGLYGSAPQMGHNCIWKNGISGANQFFLFTSPDGTVQNTLILTSDGGVNRGTIRNCTIIHIGSAGNTGLFPEYGSYMNISNSAVFNFTTLFGAGSCATEDYNATDLSGPWPLGTHSQVSLTYANQFVNSSSDWRAVNTGNLVAGTPDALVPTDITGATRSVTTPTIGCWEITSGGGPVANTLALNPGSYTETGSASATSFGTSVNAVAGSVSVTGVLANGQLGFSAIANPGAYNLVGQPIPTNVQTATLNLVPGSYGVTGAATGAINLVLALNSGSYNIVGIPTFLKGPLDGSGPPVGTYNGDFITEI